MERVTATIRIVLPAGPPGRETTLSHSVVIVRFVKIALVCSVLSCFIFLGRVDSQMSLIFWVAEIPEHNLYLKQSYS